MPGPALRGQSQRVRKDADLVQGRTEMILKETGARSCQARTQV